MKHEEGLDNSDGRRRAEEKFVVRRDGSVVRTCKRRAGTNKD